MLIESLVLEFVVVFGLLVELAPDVVLEKNVTSLETSDLLELLELELVLVLAVVCIAVVLGLFTKEFVLLEVVVLEVVELGSRDNVLNISVEVVDDIVVDIVDESMLIVVLVICLF